jgi:UDP-N-acetylglucosamine 2-epimerase
MMPLKVATVIGVRTQFIKAAAVSRAIARHNAAYLERAMLDVLVEGNTCPF